MYIVHIIFMHETPSCARAKNTIMQKVKHFYTKFAQKKNINFQDVRYSL